MVILEFNLILPFIGNHSVAQKITASTVIGYGLFVKGARKVVSR